MAMTEKMLGQAAATASAVSLYSPAANTTGIIRTICIGLLATTASRTLTFYLDNDGTTYDATTTLLVWRTSSDPDGNKAQHSEIINCFIPMNNSSGNLAIKASDVSTFVVTVMGVEIT